MKKVFSNTLLTILFPIRALRRIPKNNFVLGLIFGAIFSLIVNIVTVQIQELIQKQRILEAIENEILLNVIQANNTLAENNRAIKNNDSANYFHSFSTYSRDLWEQSSDPLRYIGQLDSNIQSQISVLYTITFRAQNQMMSRLNNLADDQLKNCYFPKPDVSAAEKTTCLQAYQLFLQNESASATDIVDQGWKILKIFHPTADRLRNPFLRFIMGDKSTRVLSGK